MRLTTLSLITLAMLTLAACTEPIRPRHGYIVGKEYVPRHHRYDPALHILRSVPDRFTLWVADSAGVVKIRVSGDAYEHFQHGDTLTFQP